MLEAEASPGCTMNYMAENGGEVKTFSFSEEILGALETSLSPERMGTYLAATQGDREKAVRLYTWNTAVSAAFYGPLQGLEVALRNAMHRELARAYDRADWYDNPAAQLDRGCLRRIANAKDNLKRGDYAQDPPHVVAALSFGFWVSLLGPGGLIQPDPRQKANYEMTLWRPALYRAFPHGPRLSRRAAHKPLNYLRTLRNRIAHHEPIFRRHLQRDYESIQDVAGWISPHKRDWIAHHSRVAELLATPWDTGEMRF